ncbi:MAG: RagB/SusD family nutrient uptake outer membrane protein [Bacteroidales bacterium]|nr:RagB/SusD family nutrient uptake outer membrane protein [Bacteroidales bacterium]
MKKHIYITAVLLIGLSAASCTDKLDEEFQLGALGSEEFYANANDDQALSLISSVYTSAWGTRGGMEGYTDDYAVSSSYQDVSNDTFSGGLSLSALYQINYKCNMIIENVPDNSEAKKRVIGEAYFFRGWAYYQLIRGWGTPPLVDHVLSTDELTPSNSTKEELWNYVQESFSKAAELIPSKPSLGSQRAFGARVSKEVVYTYMGKAYLYAGDKSSAAQVLKRVIDSGKYRLLENYSDLFTVAGDFSDEYMWEYNANDDDDAMRSYEARISYSDMWRGEYVVMPGGDHLCGLGEGHSTNQPSESFYNFMVARGEKGKNRMYGTVWTVEDAANKFVELSEEEYRGTPNYEGDNLVRYTSQGYTPYQAGYMLFWKDFIQGYFNGSQGYFQSKIYMWHSDMYTATNTLDIYSKANYPVLRYSDALLLYAEATIDSQAGLSAINEVRRRAGLDDLSSYTLKDVQDERRAEFYGEGERWFDCVRWGIAKTEFAEVGKMNYTLVGNRDTFSDSVTSEPQANYRGWDDKYLLFPYPTSELAQNPNLKQNPGW